MTRIPLLLTAVAGALALAACGSDDDPAGTASTRQDKAYEGALKFAQCMREHGVDMPDPQRDAKGGIRLTQKRRAGDGMTDAKAQAAQKDCEKYLEEGGGPVRDPATEARMQDALFAYAKCMRSHGVDMPDPKVSGGKVTFKAGGPGQGPETAAFKAADKACHQHLAELEDIRGEKAK